MEKQRGVERLIFFTDAVVAIAITLLILPLVEIVTADASKARPANVNTFVTDNFWQFFAFALSFLIIARFWIANHEVLLHTLRATPFLMWLDIAWVFTIVVLPLPTEITASYHTSQLTVGTYIGTCAASTLLLTAITLYLHAHPELQPKEAPISGIQVWDSASTAVGFLLALVLSWIFPTINYYSLLILLVSIPLNRLVHPRIRARDAARQRT